MKNWTPEETERLARRCAEIAAQNGGRRIYPYQTNALINEFGVSRDVLAQKMMRMRRENLIWSPLGSGYREKPAMVPDKGKFAIALKRAIAAGLEHAPIGVIDTPGTRAPINITWSSIA